MGESMNALEEVREILSRTHPGLNLACAPDYVLYTVAFRTKVSALEPDTVLVIKRFIKECNYGDV